MHISNANFECCINGGTFSGIQVRHFKHGRLPLFSASHYALSALGAKLNVVGAQLSFGGGENNIWHVVDLLRACAMFIISAHVLYTHYANGRYIEYVARVNEAR